MCIKETIEKFQVEKHKQNYNIPTTVHYNTMHNSCLHSLDWTGLLDPI